MLGVQLRGFGRVMLSMLVVTVGSVCMVRGFFMMARIVVLGGFTMVPRGVSMVL